SPLKVHKAARPSEKKSKPPGRIHDFHGLSSGSGIVSATYAPLPVPSLPLTVTVCFHRAGPPLHSAGKSSTFALSFITSRRNDSPTSRPRYTLKAAGPLLAGSFNRRRLPRIWNLLPEGAP